jgi:hypothetical protein
VAINVLGGVTGIGPLSGQGHPTGGTGRWIFTFLFHNVNLSNVLL